MDAWLEFGLSNGVAATLLALAAALATRWCRRPQVVLVLWLLVLAKLLAPPIVGLPAISLRAYLPLPTVESPRGTVPMLRSPRSSMGLSPSGALLPEIDAAPSVRELAALHEFPEPLVPLAEWDPPLDLPLEAYLPAADTIDEFPAFAPDENTVPETAYAPALAEALPPAPDLPLAAEQRTPRAVAAQRPPYADWLPRAIFTTWIGGSALWFAVAALRMLRFARLLRRAAPADAALQAVVRELSQRMGLARVPEVRTTRRRVPPLVWGMSGRPTILLPVELVESLSDEQRATLLAHELAHVARRDECLRWFELIAIGLYWWHPVAWWARHNAEAAQEQCCDQRVVALLPQAARAYAETLLATIEFLAEPGRSVPLGASGFSQVGHMHRRLTMILKRNTTRHMTWPAATALTAVGLLVLPLSLHTLWAEPPAEKDVEVAVEVEVVEPAAIESDEEEIEVAVEPGAVFEQIEVEVEPAFAWAVDFEQEEELTEEPRESAPREPAAIERRLERLERMIEKLARAQQHAAPAKPQAPQTARPRKAETTPKWAFDVRQLEGIEQQSEAMLKTAHKHAIEQIGHVEKAQQRVQQASEQVERLRADKQRQVDNVKELLEALRNRFVVRLEYAQTAASLMGVHRDDLRDYVVTSAGLAAAEQGRRDTSKLLEALREHGVDKEKLEEVERQQKSFEESVKRFASGLERRNSQASAATSWRWRGAGQKFTVAADSNSAIAKERELATLAVAAEDAKEQVETKKQFREWELGEQMSVPIGMRKMEAERRMLRQQLARAQAQIAELTAAQKHSDRDAARASGGDEPEALAELHKQLQHASDTMKAQIEARAKQLGEYTKHSREQLEQAAAQLKTVEAKKAQIEAELSATKEYLYDVERERVKQIAEQKLKAAEAHLKEKKDKAKAGVEKPDKPDDNDGAQMKDRRLSPYVALSYANKRLANAKDRWQLVRQVYSSDSDAGESREEAAAREDYYQIKQQTKQVVERLLPDAGPRY